MLLTDVHAHLDIFREDELDGIIEHANEAGVKAIITNGIDVKSNRLVLELSRKHHIVKAALGLYPVDSLKLSDLEIDEELSFIQSKSDSIVALGEIGLDFQVAGEIERQEDIFMRQVKMAEMLGKPVIVHSRKAESRVVELLTGSSSRVVLHCFMGSMSIVKKAVDSGFCFSIPALISRSTHFKKLVEIVPSSQLLTETDAPFLGPVAGQRSEPSMVMGTVAEIARIKGIDPEECANIIFSTYQRVF